MVKEIEIVNSKLIRFSRRARTRLVMKIQMVRLLPLQAVRPRRVRFIIQLKRQRATRMLLLVQAVEVQF